MPLQWKLKHIKADGNCFYRAIYHSSINTDNFLLLLQKLKIPYTNQLNTEEWFIESVKNKLAELILTGKDNKISKQYYNNLKRIYNEDKESYKLILQGFSSWTLKEFKNIPTDLKTFRKIYAKFVATKNIWVSELEVELLKSLLEPEIIIKILHKKPKKRDKFDKKTMYLINDSEIHYNILVKSKV
ncbi:MAG: hypothetical protein EBU66_16560 [Bacteroidetes bacterium]|nr:hypothetical protein [Bacteroidota bacterium]